MKLLFTIFFLATSYSFASVDCHQIIGKDLSVLAKQSYSQRLISYSDFQWITQKLEMAVSQANGNGFSCISYESRARLNYTVVIILKTQKDIPKGALNFLDNLNYSKKFKD